MIHDKLRRRCAFPTQRFLYLGKNDPITSDHPALQQPETTLSVRLRRSVSTSPLPMGTLESRPRCTTSTLWAATSTWQPSWRWARSSRTTTREYLRQQTLPLLGIRWVLEQQQMDGVFSDPPHKTKIKK